MAYAGGWLTWGLKPKLQSRDTVGYTEERKGRVSATEDAIRRSQHSPIAAGSDAKGLPWKHVPMSLVKSPSQASRRTGASRAGCAVTGNQRVWIGIGRIGKAPRVAGRTSI